MTLRTKGERSQYKVLCLGYRGEASMSNLGCELDEI